MKEEVDRKYDKRKRVLHAAKVPSITQTGDVVVMWLVR